MNYTPPPVVKGKKPRLGLRVAVGIGISVLTLGVIVGGIWRFQLRSAVREKIASIKAKGLPLNWMDLERWPATVTDDHNAALIIDEASKTVNEPNSTRISKLVLPVRSAEFTNRADVLALVLTNSAAMEMIYGITNAGSSRYPVNYLDGPNAKLPHLTGLKVLAQLFACDALLKADQHDAGGSARDIMASIKLSRSLDLEPILVSQLTSAAILAITTQSLERTLSRTEFSAEQLSQISEDFQAAESTNRFWVAMVGERASGNEMLRMLQDDPRGFVIMANKGASEGDQTDVPIRNPGMLWRLTGFFERDRNFFLNVMETNIAALAATPPVSLQITNEMEATETNALKGFYIMSTLLLPSYSVVVFRDADTRARLRCAIAATAAERWKLVHGGKTPESLSELVPDYLRTVPADPYDGKPLRFKKLAKGYVIYSVGRNLEDDGGKEFVPYSVKISPQERSRYDITFIVDR